MKVLDGMEATTYVFDHRAIQQLLSGPAGNVDRCPGSIQVVAQLTIDGTVQIDVSLILIGYRFALERLFRRICQYRKPLAMNFGRGAACSTASSTRGFQGG